MPESVASASLKVALSCGVPTRAEAAGEEATGTFGATVSTVKSAAVDQPDWLPALSCDCVRQ